jgi:hypothetical protein
MATIALAAIGTAVSAASAVASHAAAGQAANANNAAASANNLQNAKYRDELLHYQNETWMQDLAYAQETLGYQTAAFTRQIEWSEKARESVTRNRDAEAFTLMARGVEETIAATFQTNALGRQGAAARATHEAKDRGVEGHSVEAVLADVWRQEGEAQTIVAMNRDVTGRQLFREALAGDATADSQMSQIASSVRTYSPNTPIRTPTPVNSAAPQIGTNGPSTGALVGNLAGAAVGGFNTFANLAGKEETKRTIDNVSSWVGRQFAI